MSPTALADRKKDVTDADLIAIVEQQVAEVPETVGLVDWEVSSAKGGESRGHVTLTLTGTERHGSSKGNGPVDALYGAVDAAIEPVLAWHPILMSYEIRAVSGGEDAQGQVVVRCRRSIDDAARADSVTGHGLSTNIVEASLEAYLVATNKLHALELGDSSSVIPAPHADEELP